jgi:LacI family fructose operon transcriptional repressor
VGGIATDNATRRRMEGFADAVTARFGGVEASQLDACGYAAELAESAVERLHRRSGGLPRALFVNSTIALEGVVRFLKTLPPDELAACTFGCYDWDPFASVLSFPLLMVRQNVEGLLGEAFRIIDTRSFDDKRVIEIKPELLFPSQSGDASTTNDAPRHAVA